MDVRISPEVILARDRRRRFRGVFAFLALAVAATTTVLLINPATTQEYAPACGLEEHEHGADCYETVRTLVCPLEEAPAHEHDDSCYEIVRTPVCGLEEDEEHEHTEECFVEEQILLCTLPEGEVHEHTDACVTWEIVPGCGQESDPDHIHDETCFAERPVFLCEAEEGVGHVHSELCYIEEEILICGLEEHEHTDECYPKLKGDPHADVEIDLDWESSLINANLNGDWANDLVEIAKSQVGYAESERNFITDSYNIRRGWTRYGEWYDGNPYADWNSLYVLFCLHYAGIEGFPVEVSPARWVRVLADTESLSARLAEPVVTIEPIHDDILPVMPEPLSMEDGSAADPVDAEVFFTADAIADDNADLTAYYPEADRSADARFAVRNANTTLFMTDGDPRPGDLIFLDVDGDGLADEVGIVTALLDGDTEYPDEVEYLLGEAGSDVHYAILNRYSERIVGYGLLPENPNPPIPDEEPITLEDTDPQTESEPGEEPAEEDAEEALSETVTLEAETPDGIIKLIAPSESLPYPAEEITMTAEEVEPVDPWFSMDFSENAFRYNMSQNAIEDALAQEGKTPAATTLYDITLWYGGEQIQPEGEVKLLLPTPNPNDTDDMQIRVYQIDADGIAEEIEPEMLTGLVAITTDRLGGRERTERRQD